MKVAPIYRQLSRRARFEVLLVHTGQHYDRNLSDTFFDELGLPAPHAVLAVGSLRHGAQTARVLEAFEELLWKDQPDLVIVVGDVNSTLGCSLASAKATLTNGKRPRLAHVEAGLRSFDRSMPEEVNRVLTDAISDYLFTTEADARDNLLREGISNERIHFVGNVMIDSLIALLPRSRRSDVLERLGVQNKRYALVTMHRPSNVDGRLELEALVDLLTDVQRFFPVVFPLHPRTAARARDFGLEPRLKHLAVVTGPLPYTEFLGLMNGAAVVLTDSGGIQEETTFLGVPCVTLRSTTERPVTITVGTNELVGLDRRCVLEAVQRISAGQWKLGQCPPLWDGRAAERIAEVLDDLLS
jgi:UDP-N-acetylglucosamine 2-epimerase (non-hydrolysing)